MYITVLVLLAILFLVVIYSTRKRKTNQDWERKKALWFQELKRKFEERFPNQPFHIDESKPFTIVVPPKHPSVKGLRICDEGDNIMVEIGPFTHEHFNKSGLWGVDQSKWEDVRKDMLWDVLFFLEEVFGDKICFQADWEGDHRESGKQSRGSLDKFFSGKITYVWSGPKEEQ
jgi:hypothetical protein